MNEVVEVMLQGESHESNQEKRTLTCVIIYFLGKWLKQQLFTCVQLRLNLA
jgi:hypothetical protein